MALTPDFGSRIIHSDASITDGVAFHTALRDIEAAQLGGIRAPVIHKYKTIDLGSGAIFPAVEFINGWTLQFPAGNWIVKGFNLKATINPVASCFVDRTQSAAYAVTASGGSGPTAAEIAAELVAALAATTIPVDAKKMNGATILGAGTAGNMWRGE